MLRPGGRLITTFDISTDGKKDISVDDAEKLMRYLENSFGNYVQRR